MYCTNCGSKSDQDYIYCDNCGKLLRKPEPETKQIFIAKISKTGMASIPAQIRTHLGLNGTAKIAFVMEGGRVSIKIADEEG